MSISPTKMAEPMEMMFGAQGTTCELGTRIPQRKRHILPVVDILSCTSKLPVNSSNAASGYHYCSNMSVLPMGWLCSRVVSVLDSCVEGPGFKMQSRRCRVTVLGKLFTPIVPLSTKQQKWQPS